MRSYYRTIVLSDLHLGTAGSQAKEVVKFLKAHRCDTLILNGDIVDGWQLRRYGAWKKKHTRVIRTVLKMIEKDSTRVIYIRGNHDDFLDQVLPMRVGKFITIRRDYTLQSGGKRYYVTHGDIFDSVTTQLRWVAQLGDIGYTFLLWLNKHYNRRRERQGLPYYSLSQVVKNRVKRAVSYISDFEHELARLARVQQCDGIICGHIHQPANKMIEGIHYLNAGDWVESLTALAETHEGIWELLYHHPESHSSLAPLSSAAPPAPSALRASDASAS